MRARSERSPQESTPRFEFRWKNFRSFQDTNWIQVRPITIFIGPNNSGKTSLLRPLLLLKQTMESRDPRLALKVTGPLANLGNYHELVFQHEEHRPVELQIRFVCAPKGSFPRPGKIGNIPPGQLSLEFRKNEKGPKIFLKKITIADILGRNLLTRIESHDGTYKLELPQRLTGRLRTSILKSKPEHFLFPDTDLLRNLVSERKRKKNIVLRAGTGLYMSAMSWTRNKMKELLSSLSYVGPLRDYPMRSYEAQEEVPQTVGTRGQGAPQILFLHRDRELTRKIGVWLAKFGLAESVRCEPIYQNIFTVRVSGLTGQPAVDFADAGFGLSQLLPLIVQGLYAERNAIILLEQPEIHLNPKLQCILADFFSEVVSGSGKSIVIETHSEHIVLRIRSLIAQGKLKPDQVALYYVEKQKGASSARHIPIDQEGAIAPNLWPRGFFEDALAEALRLAKISS